MVQARLHDEEGAHLGVDGPVQDGGEEDGQQAHHQAHLLHLLRAVPRHVQPCRSAGARACIVIKQERNVKLLDSWLKPHQSTHEVLWYSLNEIHHKLGRLNDDLGQGSRSRGCARAGARSTSVLLQTWGTALKLAWRTASKDCCRNAEHLGPARCLRRQWRPPATCSCASSAAPAAGRPPPAAGSPAPATVPCTDVTEKLDLLGSTV